MANELVPMNQYAVMTMEQNDLMEILQENLGGSAISINDLQRIKFPSGGSLFWEIPTLEGPVPQKELEGVIVYQKDSRVYFEKPFEESNGEPPICYSDDAQHGMMLIDSDTGARKKCECATCPFAQWGSAKKGDGQACALNKNFFILMKDSLLPVHVKIPPASYQNSKKYLHRLTSFAKPYHAVLTQMKLEEDKNPQGIKYAKLSPPTSKVLTEEEAARMKMLHETYKPLLLQVRTESDVVDVTPDSDGTDNDAFDGGKTIDVDGTVDDL